MIGEAADACQWMPGIDELFGKLRQVERQAPQRDAEAEAHIRQQVGGLPAAPYYMAQEQALANMQSRVQELERQLAERPAGGGFLSGLLGGDPQQTAPAPQQRVAPVDDGMTPPRRGAGHGSPWGARPGGGFLAGAMQTALGVAGGVLVADALSNAFAGGEEAVTGLAEEASATPEGAVSPFQDAAAEPPPEEQDMVASTTSATRFETQGPDSGET
jgi:hypothetical protein